MSVFVQNDTYLGRKEPESSEAHSKYWASHQSASESNQLEGNNLMLLSAPNHSGKSVYLKQVRRE